MIHGKAVLNTRKRGEEEGSLLRSFGRLFWFVALLADGRIEVRCRQYRYFKTHMDGIKIE